MDAKTTPKRGYADFAEHLDRLDGLGLVRRIDAEVNKDTELHPLVRWQYRGGIPDEERKAFVFSNVTDAKGRKFDMPVVVGAMAGSRAIYRAGLGVDADGVGPIWARAIDKPIPPVEVSGAPAQEIILEGDDLKGPGKGLDALPVPISTPGYDSAPYITAGNFATRDPDTGVQNLGTYRGGLKAADRIGVRMSTRSGGAGGYPHWLKYQARGEKMPCAIVLGCPPVVAYTGPQKLPMGIDELAANPRHPLPQHRSVGAGGSGDHHRRADRYGISGTGSAVRRIPRPYCPRRFQHDLRRHRHHPQERRPVRVDYLPGNPV